MYFLRALFAFLLAALVASRGWHRPYSYYDDDNYEVGRTSSYQASRPPSPPTVNRPSVSKKTVKNSAPIKTTQFTVPGNEVEMSPAFKFRHVDGRRVKGDDTLINTRHTGNVPLSIKSEKNGLVKLESTVPVPHELSSRPHKGSSQYTINDPITSRTEIHGRRTDDGKILLMHQEAPRRPSLPPQTTAPPQTPSPPPQDNSPPPQSPPPQSPPPQSTPPQPTGLNSNAPVFVPRPMKLNPNAPSYTPSNSYFDDIEDDMSYDDDNEDDMSYDDADMNELLDMFFD